MTIWEWIQAQTGRTVEDIQREYAANVRPEQLIHYATTPEEIHTEPGLAPPVRITASKGPAPRAPYAYPAPIAPPRTVQPVSILSMRHR
jgi:hypothetical protein